MVVAQPQKGLNKGNPAPELSGKSFSAETYSLSDARGQLVLIDFRASWCKPCRIENQVVVKTYNKYIDKSFENAGGFTVFSVWLDRTEEAWERGVADDKLKWLYHISDLKGWYSKHAEAYGVRAIPANFRINGNGIIIVRELKGQVLESALAALAR